MHRFFIEDQPIQPGLTVDLSTISRQLARVLRMAPGDVIVLLDNSGHEYLTKIVSLGSKQASGIVEDVGQAEGEPAARITLYQCALKGERMEWVLQKGTELGASRFVPVISERTIVRPESSIQRKYPRWNTIIREAAEQSGRGRLPFLESPRSLDKLLMESDGESRAVRLVPWEEADGGATLVDALQSEANRGGSWEINLLIGPEGGFSAGEIERAEKKGWTPVTLGPRILRAETAAIAAVALAMFAAGEMG